VITSTDNLGPQPPMAIDEEHKTDGSDMSGTDSLPYIHKVGVPPQQGLLKEFTYRVKETFFADDPLRAFKHQSKARKFFLGLQTIFPILEWGRDYNLRKLKGDIVAGLTIASLCIPQVNKRRKEK